MAGKFGMGFLGVKVWSRDFFGFCLKPLGFFQLNYIINPLNVNCGCFAGGCLEKAVWLSGQSTGLAIWRPRVQVPPDHQLDLFRVVPSSNPQPCLYMYIASWFARPVGILNPVMFDLNYLFQSFARPHQHKCYKYCRGE